MKKLILAATIAIAGWLNLQAQSTPAPERYNDYLQQVAKMEQAHAEFLMNATMETLTKDPKGYRQMMELAERRFSDAADSLHNEGLYMAVLKHANESFVLSTSEKEKQRLLLEGAKKNMLGSVANDFDYVTPNDKTVHRLKDLSADYILIYFNNPDCESCEAVQERLANSEIVNRLVNEKKLIVLAIYPYNDTKLWKKTKYPSMMINGWNQSQQIEYADLYDLPTLPCFYLLDKSHTVLIKNEGSLKKVEAMLQNPESMKPTGPMPSLEQIKPIKAQSKEAIVKKSTSSEDASIVRCEMFLKYILNNRGKDLFENLSADLKSKAKVEDFDNILSQIESQAGKYISHEKWQKEQIQGFNALTTVLNFENLPLKLVFVLDNAGKIQGFNFIPVQ